MTTASKAKNGKIARPLTPVANVTTVLLDRPRVVPARFGTSSVKSIRVQPA